MEGLWDLLAPYGEFLPLSAQEGEYFAYSPLVRVHEAVDEADSELSCCLRLE